MIQELIIQNRLVNLAFPFTGDLHAHISSGSLLTSQVGMHRGLPSFSWGVNLTYRPWGITFNATGALLTEQIKAQARLKEFKIFKIQVSKSFGSFPR